MRTRIDRYTIVGERQIKLDTPITIEDVRLIINETKKIVIASSMQKDNITIDGGVITYTNTLPISEAEDYFTIEVDKGETINDIIGENPSATNSKLLEEIKNIASFDSELLQGKRKIASAISLKGVEASYTESLQDLSIKINQIPQKQYVSIGDDRFYYPQPYMQSIFNVAEDLKKTDMPAYIPTYMKEYKQMFSVNQFVIIDYYQQDIVLEFADGALTSDGYFYTKTTNGYTQTLPNGETREYEGDSVEHHFNNNGVINYWCAYFFTQDNYSFITSGNYFMNIIVCGKCGLLDTAKFSNIYIDGELVSSQCSEKAQANSLTLVNFSNHNSKEVIKANQYCKDIKILDLKSISNQSSIVNLGNVEKEGMQALCFLSIPQLESIRGGSSIFSLDGFTSLSDKNILLFNLRKIYFEKLKVVDSTSFIFNGKGNGGFARQLGLYNVEEINIPELEECTTLFKAWYFTQKNIFWWFCNLKRLILPSLKKVGATLFSQSIQYNNFINNTNNTHPYNLIELVDYSSATEVGNNLGGLCESHTTMANLIDFRVGALEKSINTQYWTASNIITNETKKAQLQQNIHNYIANRVSDRTGMTSLTFTFSQAVRDILLPETEELFRIKNWNIAPTKSA